MVGLIWIWLAVTLPSLFAVPVTAILFPTERSESEPLTDFMTGVVPETSTMRELPSCNLTVTELLSFEIIWPKVPENWVLPGEPELPLRVKNCPPAPAALTPREGVCA